MKRLAALLAGVVLTLTAMIGPTTPAAAAADYWCRTSITAYQDWGPWQHWRGSATCWGLRTLTQQYRARVVCAWLGMTTGTEYGGWKNAGIRSYDSCRFPAYIKTVTVQWRNR